jgi:hypothetical protein
MGYILLRWLPFAVVSTVLCALGFALTQQMQRLSADDLPARIAQDAAALLAKGTGAASVIGMYSVDMEHSLSPFLIVLSESGAVIASTASVAGVTPLPPFGVLSEARQNGEHRITWELREDLRYATVVRRFEGERPGFAVAGQNLRETEGRIALALRYSLIAWGAALLLTLLAVFLSPRRRI